MIKYFSSEAVAPGHPDRVMDVIAESIVDHALEVNKGNCRVAVDGLVKNSCLFLGGEITTSTPIPYDSIVKSTLRKVGYLKQVSPVFNDQTVQVLPVFTTQSPDIAQGVDHDQSKSSAGDNGMMYGGAIDEAPDYTGWAQYLAKFICYKIYTKGFAWARPDQKYQVTIKYNNDTPVAIDTIVCCISHDSLMTLPKIKESITNYLQEILAEIKFPKKFDATHYKLFVNPTGLFTLFGPQADSGQVNRKIVCDQYGGYFPVGGGGLCGKDATKVDRSAVYMARYLAKHIVAKGMASKCQIQVAYAIGMKDPVSLNIETFGTEKVSLSEIIDYAKQFSFIPGDIIEFFKLNKVSSERGFDYSSLGMWGHIGHLPDLPVLPWESLEDLSSEDNKVSE